MSFCNYDFSLMLDWSLLLLPYVKLIFVCPCILFQYFNESLVSYQEKKMSFVADFET